jgi:flavin-dependent dehydrogenase
MKFDQVIVGASTSGLFAAKLLAEAGQRVAVFDFQSTPNPARRTYIITPLLIPILAHMSEEALLHKIDRIMVKTSRAEVEINLKDPDLIIERNLLTRSLALMAEQSGAELFWGIKFLGFEIERDLTFLTFLDNNERKIQVRAKTVIGADGVFSQVGIAAGIQPPQVVPIIQAEIELPRNWDPSLTKVWFDVQTTPYFYWLIPENERIGVVGLVGQSKGHNRKLLEKFLIQHNLQVNLYQGGMVALYHPGLRPWTKVGNVPVFLVGDAAGQVKVTTVGGTVTGLIGAKAAVNSILTGSSYKNNLKSLKRELDLHWYIRTLLQRLDNEGYDQLVNSITLPVQSFLSSRNRDQMAGAFWKLLMIEPRLLLVGLRCLLGFNQTKKSDPPFQVSIAD